MTSIAEASSTPVSTSHSESTDNKCNTHFTRFVVRFATCCNGRMANIRKYYLLCRIEVKNLSHRVCLYVWLGGWLVGSSVRLFVRWLGVSFVGWFVGFSVCCLWVYVCETKAATSVSCVDGERHENSPNEMSTVATVLSSKLFNLSSRTDSLIFFRQIWKQSTNWLIFPFGGSLWCTELCTFAHEALGKTTDIIIELIFYFFLPAGTWNTCSALKALTTKCVRWKTTTKSRDSCNAACHWSVARKENRDIHVNRSNGRIEH